MTRALLVAAVSTEGKGQDEGNQLGPLRSTAARLGYEVAEVLTFRQSRFDDASAAEVQGTIMGRLARGDVDVLMVWALDRLTRRGVEHAFRFLRTLEDHYGVRFYSLQEPFLSTDSPSQEHRELMLSLIAWAGKWESQRKSTRVKARYEANANRAEAGGGRARWGRGSVPTQADRASVSGLVARGLSTRAIARETGLPRTTVQRLVRVAQTSPKEGGAGEGETQERPNGSIGPGENADRAGTGAGTARDWRGDGAEMPRDRRGTDAGENPAKPDESGGIAKEGGSG